jgi:hypothetical protein
MSWYNPISWFKKEEKVEKPIPSAIVKVNPVAKEKGIDDEENRIIEVDYGDKVERIKYTEHDVDALREQGIPVEFEDYNDEYEFLESSNFGGNIVYKR